MRDKFKQLAERRDGGGAHYQKETAIVVTDRATIVWREVEELRAEDDQRKPRSELPLALIKKVIARHKEGALINAQALNRFSAAVHTKSNASALVGYIGGKYVLVDDMGQQSEVIGFEEDEKEVEHFGDFLFDTWYLKKFPINESEAAAIMPVKSGYVLRYVHTYKGTDYQVIVSSIREEKTAEVKAYLVEEGIIDE